MSGSTVLLCCFLGLTPYLTFAMTPEQKAKVHEHFQVAGMACIGDHPITEADINDLRAHNIPSGENVPCFLACVMKNLGIMDVNGMLSKEKSLEQVKKVFEDPEEIKNIEDYMNSCSHVNSEAVGDGDKGCERAMLSIKCMKENASKFGFDV